MKKMIIVLALLGLGHAMFAQNRAVREFMYKFGKHEQATHLNMGGFLLKLAAKHSEDETANRVLRNISGLHLLNFDADHPVQSTDVNQLMQRLYDEKFEDLAYFKDEDAHVRFLIKEQNEIITELILIVKGEQQFMLLNLEGRFHYTDLNDLELEANSRKEFKRLPEDRKKLPKV